MKDHTLLNRTFILCFIMVGHLVLSGCDTEVSTSSRGGISTTSSRSQNATALSEQSYPLITADPSVVCNDQKFYNVDGDLTQGTKVCDANSTDSLKSENIREGVTILGVVGTLGECSSEAESNCISTNDYIPIKTESIAARIVKGYSVSGVAGTAPVSMYSECTFDGQTDCYTTSTYRAAQTSDLAEKLLVGNTVASQAGTYSPDFPEVENVLSTDTVNGKSGTLTIPNPNQVRLSVKYGVGGDGSTGTLSLPADTSVVQGVGYGASGTEATGKLIVESHSNCTGPNQVGCITTSTYKSMNLSSKDSGGALNLTSADFNTRMRSSSPFEYWDENGVRHTGNGDSDITALNIKSSISIFDINGSMIAPPSNCTSSGEQNCVSQGSYYAATTCNSEGDKTCYIESTSSFDAADLSGISADNIKSGVTIASTAGNLTLPDIQDVKNGITYGAPGALSTGTFIVPLAINVASGVQYGPTGSLVTGTATVELHSNCTAEGETNCVTTNTFAPTEVSKLANKVISGNTIAGTAGTVILPAAGSVLTSITYGSPSAILTGALTLPIEGNVLSGSGAYGNPASQKTPSYVADYPDVANVLSSDTTKGTPGTLKIPNENQVRASTAYGVSGNGSTGSYTLPDKSKVDSNISYGTNGSEFTGTLTVENHTDCTGGGQTGCITTATYKTMDLSNKDSSGALNLTSADFNTRIKSGSLFEYWDSTGTRHTGTGDTDLVEANIRTSKDLFGVNGSLVEAPSNCSSGVYQNCVPTGSYYAATSCASSGNKNCFVNSSNSLDAANFTGASAEDIKSGVTIGGISGTLEVPATSDVKNGVTYGSPDELITGTFVIPAATNVASGVKYGPVGSEITGTAVIESHTNCTAEGQTNCVTTPTYKPANVSTLANRIISGQSIAGTSGTVTLPLVGNVLSGTSYGVPTSASTGTLTLPSESNVLKGSGLYGNPSARKTPAYDPDFPDAASVLSTDTVNGNPGTLENRGDWNMNLAFPGSGYYTGFKNAPTGSNIKRGVVVASNTGIFPSDASPLPGASGTNDLTDFTVDLRTAGSYEYWNGSGQRVTGTGDGDLIASNIESSATIHGVTGTLIKRPNNCSSPGEQDCVAESSYYAAESCNSNGQVDCYAHDSNSYVATNFDTIIPCNIKSGVKIAGVTGNYPSTDCRLPDHNLAIDDLESSTFNAKMKSSTAFEYWDSKGIRHESAGDDDIVPNKIKNGVTIFGVAGIYTGPPPTPTGFTTSPASATQIDLSWDNKSVTGYLLIVREGTAVTFTPADGESYSGGSYEGSDYILYSGSSTSYNHSSGVSVGNTYYYALYSYDAYNNYSAVANTTGTGAPTCGGASDSCYDNVAAIAAQIAITPSGKKIEYVSADGAGGSFKVWKEQGGSKVLRANGLDNWAMEVNSNGKGLTSTPFTNITVLAGRTCPHHVYIDDGNKFSEDNCVYYTDGSDSGSIIMYATKRIWFYNNTGICQTKKMRLPVIYETSVEGSPSDFPDHDDYPSKLAGSTGVPSSSEAWTATSNPVSWDLSGSHFWTWSGKHPLYEQTTFGKTIICVLP